jgi:phosphoenolpyruvate synthase/pyruvate phosphate dikinase
LDIPSSIITHLNIGEIIQCIETGRLDIHLAEKRRNGFALNLVTNEVYYGKEAEDYIKKLDLIEEKAEKTDVIKGTLASAGKASGEVVLAFGTEDFHKIKQGSIVVAHMTTPWYTPYLSKVKAIITDEGGIGCHASIIARELGIPCIIGTKIATKLLKDGDFVEVNADEGIVRKI